MVEIVKPGSRMPSAARIVLILLPKTVKLKLLLRRRCGQLTASSHGPREFSA
jgi:hypothetical protein